MLTTYRGTQRLCLYQVKRYRESFKQPSKAYNMPKSRRFQERQFSLHLQYGPSACLTRNLTVYEIMQQLKNLRVIKRVNVLATSASDSNRHRANCLSVCIYLPAFATQSLLLQACVPQGQPRCIHSQLPLILHLQSYCRARPQDCHIHQ